MGGKRRGSDWVGRSVEKKIPKEESSTNREEETKDFKWVTAPSGGIRCLPGVSPHLLRRFHRSLNMKKKTKEENTEKVEK